MITGINAHCGKMGTGKSLGAIVEISEELCRKNGHVWINFHMYSLPAGAKSEPMFTDNPLADIEYMHDGLLVIDEAYLHLNARDWKDFTKRQFALFTHSDKRNLGIIIISQSFNRIDVSVREITTRARFYSGLKTFGLPYVEYEVDSAGNLIKQFVQEDNNASISGMTYIFNKKKYFKMYNTRESFIEYKERETPFPSAYINLALEESKSTV